MTKVFHLADADEAFAFLRGEHPPHWWQPTGREEPHAGTKVVQFLRCAKCGQNGFKNIGSRVIYTWRD